MQNYYGGMQGCGGYNYMQPTQQPKNEYAFVDGIEGARAYQCRPNTMMLLMDSQNPICYRKQTDGWGKTVSLEIYDLVPHIDKPPVEYVTKADFEAFKASLMKGADNNAQSV